VRTSLNGILGRLDRSALPVQQCCTYINGRSTWHQQSESTMRSTNGCRSKPGHSRTHQILCSEELLAWMRMEVRHVQLHARPRAADLQSRRQLLWLMDLRAAKGYEELRSIPFGMSGHAMRCIAKLEIGTRI